MCVFRLFAAARQLHHSKHCAKLLQHHDFLLWKIDVASCLMRAKTKKVNHHFNNTWKNEAGGLTAEAKMKFTSFYWSCMHLHGGKNIRNLWRREKLFHRFIFLSNTKMFSLTNRKFKRFGGKLSANKWESMIKFCGPEIGSDLCCGTFYGCRFRQ